VKWGVCPYCGVEGELTYDMYYGYCCYDCKRKMDMEYEEREREEKVADIVKELDDVCEDMIKWLRERRKELRKQRKHRKANRLGGLEAELIDSLRTLLYYAEEEYDPVKTVESYGFFFQTIYYILYEAGELELDFVDRFVQKARTLATELVLAVLGVRR